MEGHISTFLNIKDSRKIKSERADLISKFVDEINRERPCFYLDKNGKKKKLDLITARAVAIKVGHIKDLPTLYYFLSDCKDSRNRNGSFSKAFFGKLKI
jgi:hypothetical protein